MVRPRRSSPACVACPPDHSFAFEADPDCPLTSAAICDLWYVVQLPILQLTTGGVCRFFFWFLPYSLAPVLLARPVVLLGRRCLPFVCCSGDLQRRTPQQSSSGCQFLDRLAKVTAVRAATAAGKGTATTPAAPFVSICSDEGLRLRQSRRRLQRNRETRPSTRKGRGPLGLSNSPEGPADPSQQKVIADTDTIYINTVVGVLHLQALVDCGSTCRNTKQKCGKALRVSVSSVTGRLVMKFAPPRGKPMTMLALRREVRSARARHVGRSSSQAVLLLTSVRT